MLYWQKSINVYKISLFINHENININKSDKGAWSNIILCICYLIIKLQCDSSEAGHFFLFFSYDLFAGYPFCSAISNPRGKTIENLLVYSNMILFKNGSAIHFSTRGTHIYIQHSPMSDRVDKQFNGCRSKRIINHESIWYNKFIRWTIQAHRRL